MIGDKLIIRKIDIKRAKVIVNKIIFLPKRSVITIGGCSGTRKSELTACLQEELYKKNYLSLSISLDDYYLLHFDFRNNHRKERGLKSIGIKEINLDLLKKIIKDFKKGKKLILQELNKYINSFEIRKVNSKTIDYLIIEGLYANYLKKIRMSDFSIHLEGTPEQTLNFRLRRRKEDEKNEFRKKVVKKEYEEIQKLKRYADLIIKYEE